MRPLLIPVLLAALLCACGYKGPLYLPTPDGKPPAAPPGNPTDTQKPGQQMTPAR
ncbi:MAG TPA: lipoprotein [Burkholderiales bacterium]|nr:lipoprotein [Burkholderiales bacterium]